MKCEACGGTGEKIDPDDLRIQREMSGLDQKSCAKLMKITASYLCELEQGRRDWNANKLAKFKAALRKHKS